MTLITFDNGKVVMRDGKVGTEQECCCGCCESVVWHRVHGTCNGLPDDFVTTEVDENCYAYYIWEDWDCQNEIVDRDCGGEGQCNIFARVKITGNTPGPIEYLQSNDPDVWAEDTPGGFCDCPDSFGSLSVSCGEGEVVDSCCGWSCEYVADIAWPEIEDPEDIPDISAAMIAAGWVFRDGVGYVKVVTGEVDCDDPESVTVKAAQLEAEVDAIVAGLGGFSEVSLIPEVSGFGCFGGLTQEECEETYSGTFREGVSCGAEPCEENPLP